MRKWKIALLALAMVSAPQLANAQATEKLAKVEVTAPYLKAGEIPVEMFFKRAQFTGMCYRQTEAN